MANKALTLNSGSGGDSLGVVEINDATLGLIRREENVSYGGEVSTVVTITGADTAATVVAAPAASNRIVVTGLDVILSRDALGADVDIVVAFDTGSTIFSHPGAGAGDFFHKGGWAFGYGPSAKALQVTPTGLTASGGTLRVLCTHYIEDLT